MILFFVTRLLAAVKKGKASLSLNLNHTDNPAFLAYRLPFLFAGMKGSSPGKAGFLRAENRESMVRATVKILSDSIEVLNKQNIDFTTLVEQPSPDDLKKMYADHRAEKARQELEASRQRDAEAIKDHTMSHKINFR